MLSKRGEALANFERELIIRFQRIPKATALHAKALLGGVRRALAIYRRCDSPMLRVISWLLSNP